jgi:hypothetical protein
MPLSVTAPAAWTLANAVATARAGTLEARLDLAAIAAGLVVAGGCDHLLGVDLHAPAASPTDHWIRGADLTAVYEPADARRLRATVMWRACATPVAAWELVASAQTSLLHADATVAVVSQVSGNDVLWTAAAARWTPLSDTATLPAEATAVLVRRASTSVLVAVHPQDHVRITVARDGDASRVECGMFSAAIEKGVILRSRVLAAVGPAEKDQSWAADTCTAFAATPPFLDT